MDRATADFETRSACSLRKSGAWRYSLDPTTQVMCLAFRLPYWPEGETALWHPAFPALGIAEGGDLDRMPELFYWILAGDVIEAHNAWFERSVWTNIMAPHYGWPGVKSEQWRCSAAKAAVHALPRGLEDAIAALNLSVHKDMEGQKAMKKMMKPRKPVQAERIAWVVQHGVPLCGACRGKKAVKPKGKPAYRCRKCKGTGFLASTSKVPKMPLLWFEDQELLDTLWAYCRQDVLAEEALSLALPDLSPEETEIYALDQTVNERGFLLDKEAVSTALTLIAQETTTLNAELVTLTGGQVQKATQRAQMADWFESQGLYLMNTQRATLQAELAQGNLPPSVQRGLEIVLALGKSSTAKYERMIDWMCPDSRVRGGLLYHGASTGRWTGSGVQPHNFPKGKIKDIEKTWDALKSQDTEEIEGAYADVMTTLSHALRGVIVPSRGKQLYVADFASIEARGLLWLAEDEDALDIFRSGEDIYCSMASEIYHRPVTKKDVDERALGKVAILGLGYQMGWSKFIATAATYGITIDEEMSQRVVNTYREKFWRVKQMWNDQEAAAIQAVEGGEPATNGRIWWYMEEPFLYCVLPSGRRLAYPFPEVHERATPWGDMKPSLTFKGINPKNHQWQRLTVYGGLLVENQVQALSRDLLADAMLRCERSKVYLPVLSVHDEVIAEAYAHLGDVHEFESLVTEVPEWATGMPVQAEGWSGSRYRK